jgi:hypothetical protein
MENVFWICALVGGTLIAVQFLMMLIGFGADADGDDGGGGGHDHGGDVGHHDAADGHHAAGDHAASIFFSMLTVRTLSAAAAFFGLGGLAAQRSGMEDLPTIAIAVGAGIAAFFLVGYLMRFMHKLNVDGTVRIDRAVGCHGTVYVKIPGAKTGMGKVHVNVMSRTQEYQAVTASAELVTGVPIVVVGVVGPDTVEVASALERQAV